MLRFSRSKLAKLVSQPAVSPDAVRQFHLTSRILGCRGMKKPNMIALDQIVAKTSGAKGPAYAAALIGRAHAIVLYEKPEEALPDLTAAITALEPQKEASNLHANLYRMAKALLLRANNDILDSHEVSMSVAGAANEEKVSSLRLAVKAQYAELKKLIPDCLLIGLAEAEFVLYEGLVDKAEDSFKTLEESLGEAVTTGRVNTAYSDLSAAAYRLTRDSLVPSKLTSTLVESESSGIDLSVLGKELLKEPSLTNEELQELAIILANAETRHHFHDFFPLHDHYKSHQSASAIATEKKIRFFENPVTVSSVSKEQLKSVATSKALTSRYPSADVNKFLSSYNASGKAEGDLVNSLIEHFGSPMIAEGTPFGDAIEAISHQPESGAEVTDTTAQREFINELFRQLRFRAQVDRALSLEKLNRHHEAIKILDDVIAADSFIYMWRAYLARGRILQHLGKVEEADNDFKKLFSLKKPYVSADIPRRDENRQKSAF